MKGLIDATGLDSLRPFAAILPHMFYGLKVPPLLYRVSHRIETAFVSFPRAVMGVLGGVGHEMGAHEHHLEAEIKKGRVLRIRARESATVSLKFYAFSTCNGPSFPLAMLSLHCVLALVCLH